MIHPFRALASLAALLVATLLTTSCGYEPHDDPPVFWGQTSKQAAEAARLHARDLPGGKGQFYQVTPTGSMRPLIDDYDYIVVDSGVPFSALKGGKPVVYLPGWAPGQLTAHRLRAKDDHGWIVSGDNVRPIIVPDGRNLVSEASYRVTQANYRGVIVGIYTTRRNPSR